MDKPVEEKTEGVENNIQLLQSIDERLKAMEKREKKSRRSRRIILIAVLALLVLLAAVAGPKLVRAVRTVNEMSEKLGAYSQILEDVDTEKIKDAVDFLNSVDLEGLSGTVEETMDVVSELDIESLNDTIVQAKSVMEKLDGLDLEKLGETLDSFNDVLGPFLKYFKGK